MTVLMKCGLTDELVQFLKNRGLFVPKRMQKIEKPLRSPSEEWFYEIADKSTPPLSPAETEIYKQNPTILCHKIIDGVLILSDLSDVLHEAVRKIISDLDNEEAIAALFSVLRIFHGCLDFNYLKYDRHLEYHDYPESPVGFCWQQFKGLCVIAAKNAGVADIDSWVQEKVLKIITGPRKATMSSQYATVCSRTYAELRTLGLTAAKDIDRKMKNTILKEKVLRYSQYFHKLPGEFVNDCLNTKGLDLSKRIAESRKIAETALVEVNSNLDKHEQRAELGRLVAVIEDFVVAQEQEAFIFFGVAYPRRTTHINGVLDTLLECFEEIAIFYSRRPDLMRAEYRKTAQRLLKAAKEEVPSKLVAARKLLIKGERIMNKKAKSLYTKELKRWV